MESSDPLGCKKKEVYEHEARPTDVEEREGQPAGAVLHWAGAGARLQLE